VGVISEYERRMRSAPPVRLPLGTKLARLPDILFGPYPNRTGWVLLGLLVATAVAAIVFRGNDDERGERDRLFRSRFATLAGWVALLYLILPEFRGGYLIAERVAPLAAMLAVAALPPPALARRRLVAVLVAAVLVLQLGQTLSAFLRFRAESAGLAAVLADTAPGENLAGLIFDRSSAIWGGMPVYLHTPAYYQVEKGGRILFSFAELFQTSSRFRPGKSWDELLREWNDWNPQFFDYGRHGGRFRYFLVRGGPREVLAAFGGDPKRLGLKGKTAGEWWLFERMSPRSPDSSPKR
jgi:hypothetical protein